MAVANTRFGLIVNRVLMFYDSVLLIVPISRLFVIEITVDILVLHCTGRQIFPMNHRFGLRCVQYPKHFSQTSEMKIASISEVVVSCLLNLLG